MCAIPHCLQKELAAILETVLPISYQRDVVLRKKVSTAFRALDGSYADEVPVDKLRRRFLVPKRGD